MKPTRSLTCLTLIACFQLLAACNDDTVNPTLSCWDGLTVCGHSCCSGACIDDICYNFDSDVKNCGELGHVCDTNEVCRNGQCASNKPSCPTGKSWCGDNCVSTTSDAKNCGECGHVCEATETCINGTCTTECAPNFELCGQTCVNLARDAEHCGDCDTKCGDTTLCNEGKCECKFGLYDCDDDGVCESDTLCPVRCESDQLNCDNKCIDAKTDAFHCGSCDTECSSDQECVAGSCETATIECNTAESPDTNFTACWGKCVDTTTNAKNCGECGHACKDDEICVNSECTKDETPIESCAPPKKACYGKCVDTMTDNDHCGACLHKCASNELCEAGQCVLQCDPLTKCDGACVDTTSSSNHCGSCGNACNAGETCVGSSCQCAPGRHNCDGIAANGCESTTPCECTPNTEQACWNGSLSNLKNPAKISDGAYGICKIGKQKCDASGHFWGPCEGAVYPSAVSCDVSGNLNGLDNDCDGKIDTVCRSECELAAGEMSYIGCEYWGAYIDNLITDGNSNHTFVISNPNEKEATVYVFDKSQAANTSAAPVKTQKIAAHDVVAIEMNNTGYNMCKGSGILSNAFRVRSDIPVTAYQFSPLGNPDAHSNDASLLLPANVLGKDYIGMTWVSEAGNDHRSYIAIIATEPGETEVTVTTTSNIIKTETASIKVTPTTTATTKTVNALNKGDTETYKLNRYEVLTLMAPATASAVTVADSPYNQTGTRITSNKNIAVYGGSRSSYVPTTTETTCCRDHIEEQLFPTQAWGKSYYAARAYSTGVAGDFWLITAKEDNTKVTLPDGLIDIQTVKKVRSNKAIGGTYTLKSGESLPIFETRENFEIHADKPISVGQFLPSQGYNGLSIGDPSFILTVPYEQYRSDYDFMVPTKFNVNYITIIAPQDASIQYDGKVLAAKDFISQTQIGSTNFYVSYYQVQPGVHHMVSTKPFGLYSYGYYNMSSYGYPIGLDLKILNTN